MNLDLRQPQAAREADVRFAMPVLYFTQLMGLAFGFSPISLGLEKLRVNADALLHKLKRASSTSRAPDEGGKACV
jgi:heterodisulfide reductase subunit B